MARTLEKKNDDAINPKRTIPTWLASVARHRRRLTPSHSPQQQRITAKVWRHSRFGQRGLGSYARHTNWVFFFFLHGYSYGGRWRGGEETR
jgi:hypothetical protein